MIRSCWELHFSEQHDGNEAYGFKEWMPWYRRGGSSRRDFRRVVNPLLSLRESVGHEKVEKEEANTMYQDKAEGQRLGNFIRPDCQSPQRAKPCGYAHHPKQTIPRVPTGRTNGRPTKMSLISDEEQLGAKRHVAARVED
ncbi:hypothetical protein B296_00031164 [Ensete ventricosum]|uniref:Uncharacterized protein n=1 Tax=Ensete ventricosum TaxID=4639 RepID=A0A427AH18_ENSVE|nr:hypothetical protein B296_00031164 [Ensete ventricosum]